MCRLRLATFNPRIKFEMSTTTCKKEMKGNAKFKNSRFQPPFGGLGGNAHSHSVHLCLDGKHVVDFLLAIIAILASSHGCSTIKQNLSKSAFSSPAIQLWTVR